MVKNWNVSQMLPVPFTKWHFQISPHFHPFTLRCYFPYVSKRWFITPARGKHILLKDIAQIFSFFRQMNKHFPACHWVFFSNHLHADFPVPSQCTRRERWAGTPQFLLEWVQRGVVSREGGSVFSLTPIPWRPLSDRDQCSQIISFTFPHQEVQVSNPHKIILDRINSALFHRSS